MTEKKPAILIFDVGKTNKKIVIFDEDYRIIHEESIRIEETTDEDGFPCDNVDTLTKWIKSSFIRIVNDERFEIKAVNFSGYGASFVCLDENLNANLPLYNYLKPFPENLKKKFYGDYDGELKFSKVTASPVLGNLNSGMQLYRIRQENPEVFSKIKYALHLPQYASFLITGHLHSEITSVGCHTNLWDYTTHTYHEWVSKEGILPILPPLIPGDSCLYAEGFDKNICAGAGIHDSSAALIPYLKCYRDQFILLSTGTWSISLNPFNTTPLTPYELERDCLCFLSFEGKTVKASRLFAGHEHEQKVREIAEQFGVTASWLTSLDFQQVQSILGMPAENNTTLNQKKAAAAYTEVVNAIVTRQVESTKLVMANDQVKQIFVDGGFSNNKLYLHQLATSFPGINVYTASVGQASALGAALVLHAHWNNKPLPENLISIQLYSSTK